MYKLTKQDLENLNKLNEIEDKINKESEILRNNLYENENEKEISLSSTRYSRLVFLYNNWKNAWKQAVILGFIPILFSIPFYERNIKSIIFVIFFISIGVGMIISGLRGRKIMNDIKNNFDELGFDIDEW